MDPVSTKPYLIRAIHAWCTDQGFTPYLAVVVDAQTQVPHAYVQNGQIVLNVSYDATDRLAIENDLISFQARFGGVAQLISVPVGNVAAIYARENGHGMAFEVETADESGDVADAAAGPGLSLADGAAPAVSDEPPPRPAAGGRSHLKVVK